MICSFVCPVPGLISFKEMPETWERRDTEVMDKSLENDLRLEPFSKEGSDECTF
jgi:hypothetical protein